MNKHGITMENLVATLPVALQKDPSAVALAQAMALRLAQRPSEIDQLRIYPAIDTLDEPLLDILAYDFKVDWWDADYSLDEKRRTLKDSWRVHKLLGTKAAVVTAISAIYPKVALQEWFQYGGKPYHFKLLVDLSGEVLTEDRPQRVLALVDFYKSLRSHLEEMRFTVRSEPYLLRLGMIMASVTRLPVPMLPDSLQFTDTLGLGGLPAARTSLPVPEAPDGLRFAGTLSAAGPGAVRTVLPIPAL